MSNQPKVNNQRLCTVCHKRAKYKWGEACYCFTHYWEARRNSRTSVRFAVPSDVSPSGEVAIENGSVSYRAIPDVTFDSINRAMDEMPKKRRRRKATAIDGIKTDNCTGNAVVKDKS